MGGAVRILAAGDRIGFIDGAKNLYVKQGLGGVWIKEANGVDEAILTGSRIVIRQGSSVAAKDGLTDPWVNLVGGAVRILAAGDRIGFIDGAKNLYVKQGLGGVWIKEANGVDEAILTGSRIVIRQGSSVAAKDGLTDPWVNLVGGAVRILAAGDRIGFIDGAKNLYVKQGLGGVWIKEANGVDEAILTGSRIVIRQGSGVAAKDGLTDPWVNLVGGAVRILAAGDRIGFIDGAKNLYVKQGLGGVWIKEANGVDDTVLAG